MKEKTYKTEIIGTTIVFIVLFISVFLFLPIPIDYSGMPINGTGEPTKIAAQTVPTLVNGITTSVSIIVAFGGVIIGIMFRDKPETSLKPRLLTSELWLFS